jgi:hypothetical protein
VRRVLSAYLTHCQPAVMLPTRMRIQKASSTRPATRQPKSARSDSLPRRSTGSRLSCSPLVHLIRNVLTDLGRVSGSQFLETLSEQSRAKSCPALGGAS